jgi:hypothetical protein
MARGPLPSANARRRNAPTINTSDLPAEGRQGAVPKCPYELGDAGDRWWKWAWKLPQASKWDAGALYVVARRALLEDHAAALAFTDELEWQDIFAEGDDEAKRKVEWALGLLKRSATGEVALMKEMRELDNRLGLNPKAMADLRWSIAEADTSTPNEPAKVRQLRVVAADAETKI